MKVLINAFSFNMLAQLTATVTSREIEVDEAKRLAPEFESGVGHTDTAALFSKVLGMEVPHARKTVSLKAGDELLIGQYRGPRLPEGVSTLPVGASIEWAHVTIT